MKILTVAIPNHHFFKWIEHLKTSGHDVFWFDITDGGSKAERINWIEQFKGWKLKYDFPFRHTIKKQFPKLYKIIQKLNERNPDKIFGKIIRDIQPDIIHCFEMQLSGLPILETLENNREIPLIYSSWGSDMFYFQELGVTKNEATRFLKRADYLITDCKRDFVIAKDSGFANEFLGVFPGNGGLSIDATKIKAFQERNIILIKGYNDGVGQAVKVLQAIELLSMDVLYNNEIVVYSADASVKEYIKNSEKLSALNIKIYHRKTFIPNSKVLELMGKSTLHIANSISDGMPNALLEAMAMGSFPIQSNPGHVSEEVITHNSNGLLIENPLNETEIAQLITESLNDNGLRKNAQDYNINFMAKNYNRSTLQPQIINLYETILSTKQK